MRSGIWTRQAGAGLTLFLATATLAVSFQSAWAQQTGSALSRRLPHRPRLTAEAARPEAGSVQVTGYTQPADADAYEVLPTGPADGSVATDESLESIWEPDATMLTDGGAADCCDGGPVCWPGFSLDHLSFFGGIEASKNNSTRGQDASFGFHEGVNFGTAARNVVLPPSVGLQVGFQANQTNLEGASFTTDDRKQYFVTTGAFRRSDHGLQGGLVFDYLWDKWNYDLEVGQVRGEISFALTDRNSFGFWFANSVTDNTVVAVVSGQDVVETWDTVDYYALFYRTGLFAGGRGEGQLMAGLTEDSDGIIGGKARMPMINGWALETEFTYLVPDEPRGAGANEHESWNVGVNLIWYPGSLSCGECFRYHRPMFDVANNGSMILRREP
jgi:hypothetical protein